MAAKKTKRAKKRKKRISQNLTTLVTFRLPPEDIAALERIASKVSRKLPRGHLIRWIVQRFIKGRA